jgi:hypothetical protein
MPLAAGLIILGIALAQIAGFFVGLLARNPFGGLMWVAFATSFYLVLLIVHGKEWFSLRDWIGFKEGRPGVHVILAAGVLLLFAALLGLEIHFLSSLYDMSLGLGAAGGGPFAWVLRALSDFFNNAPLEGAAVMLYAVVPAGTAAVWYAAYARRDRERSKREIAAARWCLLLILLVLSSMGVMVISLLALVLVLLLWVWIPAAVKKGWGTAGILPVLIVYHVLLVLPILVVIGEELGAIAKLK